MSDPTAATIQSSSAGGLAGEHPGVATLPVFVGPSTGSEGNHITTSIIPIACWRVDDVRFDFDSSFVLPEVADEVTQLGQLRQTHALAVNAAAGETADPILPPISIFGHADPVGSDDYNKQLSGRRATAVYAMLTRRPDLWETLYSHPGEHWGADAIQTMLTTVQPSLNEDPDKLQQQTSANQNSAGTRAGLFSSYMDKICGDLKLDPKDDFLAGTDSGGKGDYQGCSEFNPLVLFTQQEEQDFTQPELKEKRDAQNAPNRRVVALLFRPGTRVTASKWPCPTVSQGIAGCQKRFWSDGETRRSTHLPDKRRHFDDTHDTFACRFYQRLANDSPCEKVVSLIPIQLLYEDNSPMANAEFEAVFDDVKVPGKTDADGRAVIVRPEDAGPTFELFLNSFPEQFIYPGEQGDTGAVASSAAPQPDFPKAFWPHGIMGALLAAIWLLWPATEARAWADPPGATECQMDRLPAPMTLTGPLYMGAGTSSATLTFAVGPQHPAGNVKYGDAQPLAMLDPKLEVIEVSSASSQRRARYRLIFAVDQCESSPAHARNDKMRRWDVCFYTEGEPRPVHRVDAEVLLIRQCVPHFDLVSAVGVSDVGTLSEVFRVTGSVRQ
jgi:hypothetical protein